MIMFGISSAHFWKPSPFKININNSVRASSSLMDNTNNNTPPKRVVVCGGGVIGVCVAYYLSKQGGAAVTLIEKSSIACAASGKAGGFLALDWCDGGPLSSLARTSFNLHRSLAEELDGPQSYGYRPLTTLSVSIQEPSSKSKSSNWAGPNIPSWVDGPAKQVRTIGSPETTAQVDPRMFTKTLLSRAVGVEVVIGKVESVTADEGRVTAVVVEGGRVVEADAVVLALGPWSSKLELLSSLFRVCGIKAHSIILEPKVGGADEITPHALFLTYHDGGGKPMDPEVYPRPNGEVYICGMSAEAEVPDDPEEICQTENQYKSLRELRRTYQVTWEKEEPPSKQSRLVSCHVPMTVCPLLVKFQG